MDEKLNDAKVENACITHSRVATHLNIKAYFVIKNAARFDSCEKTYVDQ